MMYRQLKHNKGQLNQPRRFARRFALLFVRSFVPVFALLVLSGQAAWSQSEETELSDAEFSGLQGLVEYEFPRTIESEGLSNAEFTQVKSLLSAAEKFRGNIGKDFVFDINVIETKDKEVKSDNELKVFVNLLGGETSSRHVISKFVKGRSVNTLVLQRDFNMWFYKQGTRVPIRISPAQRLIGGASYADISNTNYAEHYDPVRITKTVLGKVDVYKIYLKKLEKGVAYETIGYYVSQDTKRPVKADFFTRSGKLIKTMYFRKFENLGGRTVSREWAIVDRINSKLVTFINVVDITYESQDDSLFTPERIKDF